MQILMDMCALKKTAPILVVVSMGKPTCWWGGEVAGYHSTHQDSNFDAHSYAHPSVL